MNLPHAVLITGVLCALTLNVHASQVKLGPIDSPACVTLKEGKPCISLVLSGEIENGSAASLKRMIEEAKAAFAGAGVDVRVGLLFLDSPGGDIEEAMQLGKMLRQNLMGTFVDYESQCHSSCVIAFTGGVSRLPLGKMGVHSFYSSNMIEVEEFEEESERYNAMSETLSAYLREMRIPTRILDMMKTVPYFNLRILTREEKKELGLLGLDPVYARSNQRE